MNVSILIPSRNNVEYLQLAYDSIRKHQGNHHVEVLLLDDNSDKDNTWEWCNQIADRDENVIAIRNNKSRFGISGGYKYLSKFARMEIICHWHADMIMTADTLDAVERRLYPITRVGQAKLRNMANPNSVVCLTRVEPPIYNPGPEKVVWQSGPITAEEWNEDEFKKFISSYNKNNRYQRGTTKGHFAPFFMFTDEYRKLGAADTTTFPLQSREDSDFAFRLALAGFETIQIPHFVYHFASRGNRRSKHEIETSAYKDNPEWIAHNKKAERNFIRKWGTMVMHNEYLEPIPPKKYSIGFLIKNCTEQLLQMLEPWCDLLICDLTQSSINAYIEQEQPNTAFKLENRVFNNEQYYDNTTDIMVQIDGDKFGKVEMDNIILLSKILEDSGELGWMELGNLSLNISSLESYEKTLITCEY